MSLLLTLLIIVAAVSCIFGDEPARATAIALLCNWCLNTAFVAFCSETDPWAAFLVVDYMTGFVLAVCYQSTLSRLICFSYAIECVSHGAYGYVSMTNNAPVAAYMYWWVLYYIALAQVALVGGSLARQCVGHRHRAGSRLSFGESGTCESKVEGTGQ